MREHLACTYLQGRAQAVLAGGPATLSKHWSRYPANAPAFLLQGNGAYVTCPDGVRYLDACAALGPILLGHQHGAVTTALQNQLERLISSTLSTALEVEVAELLCSIIPGAEMCRFALNGKDVTEAAVKLARHVTGQDHVAYCGYAGGFSDYLSTTDKRGGILPELAEFNHQISWRDFVALEEVVDEDLAAVILEVPPEAEGISIAETAAVIQRYADAAHRVGALFILDEVVTGLRMGLGGAQAYYGVQADLVTMSKALGNGVPIAALLGSKDLMRIFEGGTVFLSTTFGGNPLGLAAAKATLETLMTTDALHTLGTYGEIAHHLLVEELWLHDLPATVRGNFARWVIDWQGLSSVATGEELRTLWLQELIKGGVLAGVPWFSMCCWDEDVVRVIAEAVHETCGVLADVVRGAKAIGDALEGPVINNVFERYIPERRP